MAMADVTLGGVVLDYLEVPPRLSFGGEQVLSVHKYVGGKRKIDAMGSDPAPIEWAGVFSGELALERALFVDGLRKAGKTLGFTFDLLNYDIVIKSLHFDLEMRNWIPYKIICEVLTDNTAPIKTEPKPDISGLLNTDSSLAGTLSGLIGNAGLDGFVAAVTTASAAVSTVANTAQDAINGVLQPIQNAQNEVSILIGSAQNTIQNIATFGGVLPDSPVSDFANKITSQIDAMTDEQNLYSLDGVLGRMKTNATVSQSAGRKITAMNTTLYRVASDEYGDASAWEVIAKANKLTDPVITSAVTLNIPEYTA